MNLISTYSIVLYLLVSGCLAHNKTPTNASETRDIEASESDENFLKLAELQMKDLVASESPFLTCATKSDGLPGDQLPSSYTSLGVYQTQDPNFKYVLAYKSSCGICETLPTELYRKMLPVKEPVLADRQSSDEFIFGVVGYYGPLENIPPTVGLLNVVRSVGESGKSNVFNLVEDFVIRTNSSKNSDKLGVFEKSEGPCKLNVIPKL